MFWRRKPPGGEEVSDEYAAGMRAMEAWYHEFVIWAYAYISLLEKQLLQRENDRCCQGEHRNNEGCDADDES